MVNEREVEPSVVERLAKKIVDPSLPLPERYRVLFALRNVAGTGATDVSVRNLS